MCYDHGWLDFEALVKREQDAIRDNFETDFLLNKLAVEVIILWTEQREDF